MTELFATFVMFIVGLLAGVFLGSCLVEHAARTLDAVLYIAYKHAKEAVFDPVMPVFFGACLVLSIVAAAVSSARLAFFVAALFLCGALAITIIVHLPLNKSMKTWSPQAYPANWDAARRRWRDWNWVRCGLTIVAFAAIAFG